MGELLENRQKDFHEFSYLLHEREHAENHDDAKIDAWTRSDTVDAWRHNRRYQCLDVLLEQYPNASWLTVGDGRVGTDAHYIGSKGVKVLATDIAEHHLNIARTKNFIDDYRVENAEALSFGDGEFDFVLCKETYHHFPRPMLALYEMLRVARKGVVLIEPSDAEILTPSRIKLLTSLLLFWETFKNRLRDFLGKERWYKYIGSRSEGYEASGNYIYRISEREIEKVALGLNFDTIAFKVQNDCYIKGVEFEKADDNSELYKKVKAIIDKADRKCKLGLAEYGILVAMIFKTSPSRESVEALERDGFRVDKLPKNPHAAITDVSSATS